MSAPATIPAATPLGIQAFPLQKADAPSVSGTFLIEASAGTGKTHNIKLLYLRLVLERQLQPRQILVVTFTEAATAELRDRIRGTLDQAMRVLETGSSHAEESQRDKILEALVAREIDPTGKRQRIRQAQLSLDEAAIHTIHGFCSRMLREFAFEAEATADLELSENDDELVAEIVQDFWRQRFYVGPPPAGIQAGVTLAELTALAGKARHPGAIALCPGKPEGRRPAAAILEDLKRILDQDGPAIQALLTDKANGLSKTQDNQLKPPDVAAAFAAFQGCAAADLPVGRLLPYSASALRRAVTPANQGKKMPPAHEFFDRCEELAGAQSAWRLELMHACAAWVQQELPVRKARQKLQTYDDMILGLYNKVARGGQQSRLATKIRDRYQVALVDEFQDTDPHQFEIFNAIFGTSASHLFFMIGDPKQSIYKFRGADIQAYLECKRQVPAGHLYTLAKNFRSSGPFVAALNAFYGHGPGGQGFPNPFAEEGIGYLPVGCGAPERNEPKAAIVPFQFRHCLAANKAEAGSLIGEDVAGQIQLLLQQGWQPEDMAVLVRNHRQAQAIQATLREWRIPAVIYKSGNVFDSEEARDLLFILSAVLEPNAAGLVRGALATRMIGVPLETLAAGTAPDEPAAAGEAGGSGDYAKAFDDLRLAWERQGFSVMANRLMTQPWGPAGGGRSVLLTLAGTRTPERNLSNLRQLIDILQERQKSEACPPETLLRWFSTQVLDEERRQENADAYEMRLETDAQAVTVMTVHKSKGLQFPVVFCPFLWEPKVEPHPQQPIQVGGKLALDEAAEEELRPAWRREAFAEDLRLLYVSVTRARAACILHTCEFTGSRIQTRLEHSALNAVLAGDASLDASGFPTAKKADGAALAAAAPELFRNTVLLEPPPESAPAAAMPAAGTEAPLLEPAAEPAVEQHWGVLSFSALAAGRTREARGQVAETPAAPHPKGGADEPGTVDPGLADLDLGKGVLAPFRGGTQLGTCVHEIFEEIDFQGFRAPAPDDGSEAARVIGRSLRNHGFMAMNSWQDPGGRERFAAIAAMLANTLEARLPELHPGTPGGFRLSSIARKHRLSEMTFDFGLPARIRLEECRRALELAPEFAGLELALGGGGAHFGFMTGSIDLVFEHDGRYYFADWKTNRLDDYGQGSLKEEMFKDGYILQLYIYATALDRFLQARLPGYCFETHFGGGYYLFVRNVGRDGQGIFGHRPSRKALESFKAALALAPQERNLP